MRIFSRISALLSPWIFFVIKLHWKHFKVSNASLNIYEKGICLQSGGHNDSWRSEWQNEGMSMISHKTLRHVVQKNISLNHLHISHYFETPLAIYQVACWIHIRKFYLVSCFRSIPRTFSSYLLEKTFYIQSILLTKKKMESLSASSGEGIYWIG